MRSIFDRTIRGGDGTPSRALADGPVAMTNMPVGNLTSGGMMANFIGLKAGRDAVTRDEAQRSGIRDSRAVYASEACWRVVGRPSGSTRS
jgi:hypothetical protein